MLRHTAFAAALVFVSTAPIWAQTSNETNSTPSMQNSGAGISGQPGNKNGPAPQKQTTGSMNNDSASGQPAAGQDASKIPGKPGGKSGPAQKPSNDTMK